MQDPLGKWVFSRLFVRREHTGADDLADAQSFSLESSLAFPSPARALEGPSALSSPPPSIIPSPGSPPGAPNVSATIAPPDGIATIAADQYVYNTSYVGDLFGAKIVNHGIIWDNPHSPDGISGSFDYGFVWGADVENDGKMVLIVDQFAPQPEGAFGSTGEALAFDNNNGHITNSGDIWVYASNGDARVLETDYFPTVTNSGLMAARSETHLTVTLYFHNFGWVNNQAGGSILAEGLFPIAIHFGRGIWGNGFDPIQLRNAGLIEAVSTSPDVASVAVDSEHLTIEVFHVINSGTIRGDWAITSSSASTTIDSGVDIIDNEPGGLIEGIIALDRGDDIINNRGTINGPILFGEGNDSYDDVGGIQNGLVDMFWGDDTFKGGDGADFIGGEDGNDSLTGGGGADELTGGGNDDTLTGGAGNDALYGEYGNDRIITEAGDVVSGGHGDDRIELGDYRFASVAGDEGFDTLVLPQGPKTLDLSLVLASGRLASIEDIDLATQNKIVVRAADVDQLNAIGRSLRLEGDSSDQVFLIGSWTNAGSVTIDGLGYAKYTLSGDTALIRSSVAVSVQSQGVQNVQGLDLIATGIAAPDPATSILPLTPNDLLLYEYEISQSIVINPEEVFWNDGLLSVLRCTLGGFTITNYGGIESLNVYDYDFTLALEAENLGHLINYGEITSESFWDQETWPFFFTIGVQHGQDIVNHGLIQAQAVLGLAVAVRMAGIVHNYGDLFAYSEFGQALGISDSVLQENAGTITAIGYTDASAVEIGIPELINSGTIQAFMLNGGQSVGIRVTNNGSVTISNSGTITADVAIQILRNVYVGDVALTIKNTGSIHGDIQLADRDDQIQNSGTIAGNVFLAGGDDLFDSGVGHYAGVVFGEDGNDVLKGGVENETLDGGVGNDTLTGGGGIDTASYEDATAGVVILLGQASAQNTGGAGIDTISGVENLIGSDYADTLAGTGGDNVLRGRAGDDKLTGGAGSDTLTGDAGSDAFRFVAMTDISSAGDHITDFSVHDRIDLSTVAGLAFIGQGSFSNVAGQLRYGLVGNTTVLELDSNGDGVRDGRIVIDNGAFNLVETAPGSRILIIPPINGSSGDDNLAGTAIDDIIHGNNGNDVLSGGTGDDLLDGGAGSDTASYAAANGPVAVDLSITGAQPVGADQGSDTLVSIENLNGSSFDDLLLGSPGENRLVGGAGNNTLKGQDGNDTLDMTQGSADAAFGGNGDDAILVGSAYGSDDTVDGGNGNDLIILAGDYSAGVLLSPASFTGIEQIRLTAGFSYKFAVTGTLVPSGTQIVVDASTLSAANTLIFDGSQEGSGGFNALGGAGNDVVSLGVTSSYGDNSDTVSAGAGNDTIVGGTGFSETDKIDGGAGYDTLSLRGNYHFTLASQTLVNVEQIDLAPGCTYRFGMNDGNVGAGKVLAVNASALGGPDRLELDGSAEHDGSFNVTGGANVDVVWLGLGNDTVLGGGGNDWVNAGAGFSPNDKFDGGTGNDMLVLNGDYGAGLLLTSAVLANVETIYLVAGHNYKIVFDDTVAAVATTMTIDGSRLAGSDAMTIDGSAETEATLVFYGGSGNDRLIAGMSGATISAGDGNDAIDITRGGNQHVAGDAGDDTILAGAAFTTADVIDGWIGYDTLQLLGDYGAGLALAGADLTSIEQLVLGAGYSYSLTIADSVVTVGQGLKIDAGALAVGNVLTLDGSQDTDGNFTVLAGDGDDVLHLGGIVDIVAAGKGSDAIYVGAGLSSADQIDGGLGTDTLFLDGNYKSGLVLGALTVAGIEQINLSAGFQYKLTMNDGNVAAGKSLIVNGSLLGAADALIVDGSLETDGKFAMTGGLANDVLTGGAQADSFDITLGGKDTINGGAGDDAIVAGASFNANDKVDGGAGNDTLSLAGDYSSGMTFNTTALLNVEKISVSAGFSYSLTSADATVAAGQFLTVDGSHLGATDKLVFKGGAETDGHFTLLGGAGNDLLVGGAGDDTINGGGGKDLIDLTAGGNDTAMGAAGDDTFKLGASLTALDHIDGGTGGHDLVDISGDYAAGLAISATTFANIDKIKLHGTHSYALTTNDANLGAGQVLAVDGSDLGAMDRLTFIGSAESDGAFQLTGGAGDDVLTGGAGADKITGGLGVDLLTGGGGADLFLYRATAESTGAGYDTVTGFDFAVDRFDLARGVKKIDAAIAAGTLSGASFDADLASAVDAAHLGKFHAVLFTASAGTLVGQTFLVVDTNGAAGYQAGADMVFHLDSALNVASIALGNFI